MQNIPFILSWILKHRALPFGTTPALQWRTSAQANKWKRPQIQVAPTALVCKSTLRKYSSTKCSGANVPLEEIWREVFGEKTSPSAEYYARHVLGGLPSIISNLIFGNLNYIKLDIWNPQLYQIQCLEFLSFSQPCILAKPCMLLLQEIWVTTGATSAIQGMGGEGYF